MLKAWMAEILAIIISVTAWNPLYAQSPTSEGATGKALVIEAKTSYEQGEYDTFLDQLHEQYERAGKAGALRGLFGSAKAAIVPEANRQKEKLEELKKERNQRLLDAIAENADLEIIQRVDAVVFHSLSSQQEAVLEELDEFKYSIPATTEGTVENKISALETEYYIKSLLLDIAKMRNDSDPNEITKKKIALQLQKLDKMDEVVSDANDVDWMKKIQMAKSGFPSHKAYKIELEKLKALAMGVEEPQNSVEEKVKEIMMDFHMKQRENYSQDI